MGMTMIEKILANHSDSKVVKAGDTVTCKVDWAVLHDMFFSVGGQADRYVIKKLFDPDRCLVVMDHAVPAPTINDADAAVRMREFVARLGISRFFDVGNHGVIHQLLAEKGYALPGKLMVCGDSHSIASGALNCAARGLGPVDMVYIFCLGETWFQVGPTIYYDLSGSLPAGVNGKDLFLYIAGNHGDFTGKNVEFGGEGVENLSLSSRQSVATMCAEINADFALFPCDQRLEEYLQERAVEPFQAVAGDADAEYEMKRSIHLNDLVPYVSLPHFIPGNCRPVSEVSGMVINQGIIGSCSNGRLDDLQTAADILKGKKIADGVRLIITPASQQIYRDAMEAGYLTTLLDAGAVITNPTCGACYGGHMGLIGRGERCLATTTRNFKGRMGSAESEVLLASPATVAASVITGKITDPREMMS